MDGMKNIILDVLSPESAICYAVVSRVELPGTLGRFVVLKDHAPLISSLEKGDIVYDGEDGQEMRCPISSGFVEICDNHVIACVER